MNPLHFPSTKIAPVEDASERHAHTAVIDATAMELEAAQTVDLNKLHQLADRAAACEHIWMQAQNAIRARLERVSRYPKAWQQFAKED